MNEAFQWRKEERDRENQKTKTKRNLPLCSSPLYNIIVALVSVNIALVNTFHGSTTEADNLLAQATKLTKAQLARAILGDIPHSERPGHRPTGLPSGAGVGELTIIPDIKEAKTAFDERKLVS